MAEMGKFKVDVELPDDLKKFVGIAEALIRGVQKPDSGTPAQNQDEIQMLRRELSNLRGRNAELTSENYGLNKKIRDMEAEKGLLGSEHTKDEQIRSLQALVSDLQAQQAADLKRIEALEAFQRPLGDAPHRRERIGEDF